MSFVLQENTATPMPKARERTASHLLEIVHSDVCGPMRIKSVGGAAYFATFRDDRYRWIEVHFLKSKDEVKTAFMKFQELVENQKERRIKILRTDNGLEYNGMDFTYFFEQSGIKRERTVPYTPQQNGVAERMNRTLNDMARCMVIQAGLPQTFWAEAIATAAYIRNRCPTKPLDKMTPYEAWYGSKPNVSHFRTFGSSAWALNKEPTEGKSDLRSVYW